MICSTTQIRWLWSKSFGNRNCFKFWSEWWCRAMSRSWP